MKDEEEKLPTKRNLAHVDYTTQRCQYMKEHAGNVAAFSRDVCQIPEFMIQENWEWRTRQIF